MHVSVITYVFIYCGVMLFLIICFIFAGSFTNPLNYYRANFLRNFEIERRKNIPRGLMILGEKDAFISRTTCSLIQDNYKDFQVEILKGGRHFIQQENYVEVNEILRNFLIK